MSKKQEKSDLTNSKIIVNCRENRDRGNGTSSSGFFAGHGAK
jgi:hypothetical protein